MKISYRNIAEFLGLSSVVASLIFVGVQLMLDRRVALGSQYHERMTLGQEYYLNVAGNDGWVSAIAKQREEGYLPDFWNGDIEIYMEERNLTMEDAIRIEYLYRSTLIRLNNNYYQFSNGLLEGDIVENLRVGLKRQMSNNPIHRGASMSYVAGEDGFNSIILEIDTEIRNGL